MLYKLSPSKLEVFRKYATEAFGGFFDEQKVIESLTGQSKWSPSMEFGSAYHGLIEHGGEKFYNQETGLYHYKEDRMDNEVTITPEQAELAFKYRKAYPMMIHECSATHVLKVDGVDVLLNMRIDGISNNRVHEIKTTSHNPKIADYEDSLQWRCYLLATSSPYVQYDVFSYNKPKNPLDRKVDYFGFKLWRYGRLESDVIYWIRRLIEFAEIKDLTSSMEVK